MKKQTTTWLKTLAILIVVFPFTPLVSKYSGCMGGGPEFGCALGVAYRIVFPVFRTAACLMWHEAGCAPDTFLPGWYSNLLNLENLIILTLLILLSRFISSKLTK